MRRRPGSWRLMPYEKVTLLVIWYGAIFCAGVYLGEGRPWGILQTLAIFIGLTGILLGISWLEHHWLVSRVIRNGWKDDES
jgi:hypothetical protein